MINQIFKKVLFERICDNACNIKFSVLESAVPFGMMAAMQQHVLSNNINLDVINFYIVD
ncbi:MAG: hypothetical protein ACR2PB_07160 [Desulfocapsaceae bacterium]